jgi:peptide-methionine (S)-S-oxide reductase
VDTSQDESVMTQTYPLSLRDAKHAERGAFQKGVDMNQDNLNTHSPASEETATLAGGCFWCLEAVFDDLKGVTDVVSGYSGGSMPNPNYQLVCTGMTGHAEVVQIKFDPAVISYHDLLGVFFTMHDPTTKNRQGADVGTQYRSVIFTHSPEQKATAEAVIKEIEAERLYANPVVTEVVPFKAFYAAEDYHQNYFATNPNQPYCRAVVAPKVAKFRSHYLEQLKKVRA